MDCKLMFASGYWRASRDLLRQVDPNSPMDDRGVDYIIAVKNLPDKFIEVEKIPIKKYYCETCDKPVPEWEVENKIGCFINHKLRQDITYKKNYQVGMIDVPSDDLKARKPMLKDAIRIHLSNPQGQNMANAIFDYVKRVYPIGRKIEDPIALGTKSGWLIEDESQIPVWELPKLEKEEDKQAGEIVEELLQCPHCEKQFKDKRSLRMHIMRAHPEIFKMKEAEKEALEAK